MIKKIVSCSIIIASLLLFFTSCNYNKIDGTWDVTRISYGMEDDTDEESLKAQYPNGITFNADGTFFIESDDDVLEGEYNYAKGKGTLTAETKVTIKDPESGEYITQEQLTTFEINLKSGNIILTQTGAGFFLELTLDRRN